MLLAVLTGFDPAAFGVTGRRSPVHSFPTRRSSDLEEEARRVGKECTEGSGIETRQDRQQQADKVFMDTYLASTQE